jgi:hypothetical protein
MPKKIVRPKGKPKPRVRPGSDRMTDVRGIKKQQQVLATRVRDAALKSGMSWADWTTQRKTLVEGLRVKGRTSSSKKAVKAATKLIRKSEGAAAAKAYKKKARSVDKRGPKTVIAKTTMKGKSGTKKRKKGY